MTTASEGSFGSLVDFINQKGVVQTNDYLVQAQGTPDMTVKVTPGTAYLPSIASVPPSINATIYSTILDANTNVTIAANSSGNPRIDAVVLYIDTAASPTAQADNVAKFMDVQGTPAVSPVAPTDATIQSTVGASNPFIRLTNVTVGNGVTSINSGNLADQRVYCDPIIRRKVVDGTNTDFTTAAKALVAPQVTAPPKLAAGNQETGVVSLRFYNTSGTNATMDVAVNFKTVMTNVPSSITFAGGTSVNLAVGLNAQNISVYGFRASITSNPAAGDTYALNWTYTTVGN